MKNHKGATPKTTYNLIKSEKVKAFRLGKNGKWNILKLSVKQMLKNLNNDGYDE